MSNKKAASPLRWLVLLLACVTLCGNYYSYDTPAALSTQLKSAMGSTNFSLYFNLLYSLYSIPNIVLPFFGGFFVDKLGVRVCLLGFATLITAGQLIFAFGLSVKSWPVMFIGRVVYGFGGESLGVANSALLADWFQGRELAFAFGLNLSVARLGSVMNNLLSPVLASKVSLQFALWFGAILCAGGVGCVVLMATVEGAVGAGQGQEDGTGDGLKRGLLEAEEEEGEIKFAKAAAAGSVNAGPDAAKSNIISSSSSSEPLTRSISIDGRVATMSIDESRHPPQFRDVLSFPLPFWILALSCVVVYGCVLPFNNIASALLLERDYFMAQANAGCALSLPAQCQNVTNVPNALCDTAQYYAPPLPLGVSAASVDCTDSAYSEGCESDYCSALEAGILEASRVMSIPYIISACLSPVLGGFVDRFGYRAVIATVAPLVLVLVHGLMGFSRVDPVGPLVGQGLAYSAFAAVLWPSVPLVVQQRYIGLGYGVVTSIQNGGLAAFPLIVSAIDTSTGGYIPSVEVFFVTLACLGVAVGVALNVWDVHNGNVFNRSSASASGAAKAAGGGGDSKIGVVDDGEARVLI